jgi:RNA polymerase sigma factor (sigma-70 family)
VTRHYWITEAAIRMTQQTTPIHVLAAPGYARARACLNDLVAWLTDWMFPAEANATLVTAGAAAMRSNSRWIEATSVHMAPTQAATAARPSGKSDTLVRFQRDIVPQLDAAYNFARFLSRDADAAQDIVQEAFLRAYRGFDGYQGGDARAWIFAIVRNCYHNWLLERRRKASHEVDVHGSDDADDNAIDNVASDDDSPETALLRRAESGAVRRVLNTLPRAWREILVLRELEGLSYRQIAQIAALPIGTVMSRLARARTRFESAWRQQADQETAS